MKRPPVPVLDSKGNKIGEVSAQSTSVGASKVAGAAVEWSGRFGVWAWVVKTPIKEHQ